MSILFLCLCLWLSNTNCFYMPKLKHYPNFENAGEPIFVSYQLPADNVTELQEACALTLIDDHISFSGYITPRFTNTYTTNLFFWFFPSELSEPNEAPLVLSLQGGTGVSFLVSIFEGVGPYFMDTVNKTILLRDCRLTKHLSVLYIDHPAGSGYSYTEDDIGYSYSKAEVADLLISALRDFFLLFPSFSNNPFFIYGESYSSSYVPALARAIFRYNNRENEQNVPINLTGVIMGSTMFDPINMISNYSTRLHNLGLVNSEDLSEFEKLRDRMNYYINRTKLDLAFKYFDKMVLGGITKYPTLFQNTTNHISHFNYKVSAMHDEKYHESVAELIQCSNFRSLLNIGDSVFNINYRKVLKYMAKDILVKLDPVSVNILLKYGYKVLIYGGERDALVPYSLTDAYLKTLKWTNRKKFNSSLRSSFRVNYKISGYYTRFGTLWQLLMLDAGHMVSKDQPIAISELITRFVQKTIY